MYTIHSLHSHMSHIDSVVINMRMLIIDDNVAHSDRQTEREAINCKRAQISIYMMTHLCTIADSLRMLIIAIAISLIPL